jgi:glutamate-ammonia-ligase adenylyltransferase
MSNVINLQSFFFQQPPPIDLQQQLDHVLLGSDFVAEQLQRAPQILSTLVDSQRLFRPMAASEFVSTLHARIHHLKNQQVETNEAFDIAIRQWRQCEYVRIIWRDLTGAADLIEVMNEVSYLAEAALQACVDWHFPRLLEQYGTPTAEDSGRALTQHDFMIIALGKLGAGELNLSSDIDLMFAFSEPGMTNRTLSNQEFFNRLGQKIIHSLHEISVEGFVFRVDMRLRPYGNSGALTQSLDALEAYYQDQGRPWERYALIKARAMTGGDANCARLQSIIAPFVYRKYVDFTAIHALREMKALINREVLRQGAAQDIKTGTGGIREIEFIVQVFQLIHGGRETCLQALSLFAALEAVLLLGLLPPAVGEELRQAYIFLRRLENRLQALQDRQTHQLPSDAHNQQRIARMMDFADWESFSQSLEQIRYRVRGHFSSMVRDASEEQRQVDPQWEWYQAWWSGEFTEQQTRDLLANTGFADVSRAIALMSEFRQSMHARNLQAQGRERLDQLMPLLLLRIAQCPQAELVLVRVLPIIEQIVRRSAYLSLLIERPHALQRLVTLCAASVWIPERIARFPNLLDELLYDFKQLRLPTLQDLQLTLEQQLLRAGEYDLEAQMEILRDFKNVHLFHVAVAEITGAIALMDISDALTFIAQTIIDAALRIASEHMIAQYGYPQGIDGPLKEIELAIIAYGKMGGFEISYGSDLDLVFIYRAQADLQTQGPKSLENGVYYGRLAQRVIHMLSTMTHGGRLYEVDTRLRPSGESGLLVCQFSYLREYLFNQAWTWEHQALVKARGLVGHAQLLQDFHQLRHKVLCYPRLDKILRIQVVSMRTKMLEHLGSNASEHIFDIKQDRGGVIDIEFLVQYGVLLYAQQYPELTLETGTIRSLRAFAARHLLAEVDAECLVAAYMAYRSTSHALILKNQQTQVDADEFVAYREQVQRLWRAFVCLGKKC